VTTTGAGNCPIVSSNRSPTGYDGSELQGLGGMRLYCSRLSVSCDSFVIFSGVVV
jgi:hypothetical protein